MNKKQLRKLCLSAAVLFSGLTAGTSASAIFCTPCKWLGAGVGYYYCHAGAWHLQIVNVIGPRRQTIKEIEAYCDAHRPAGCVVVANNPNPYLPPVPIPPGC